MDFSDLTRAVTDKKTYYDATKIKLEHSNFIFSLNTLQIGIIEYAFFKFVDNNQDTKEITPGIACHFFGQPDKNNIYAPSEYSDQFYMEYIRDNNIGSPHELDTPVLSALKLDDINIQTRFTNEQFLLFKNIQKQILTTNPYKNKVYISY